MTIHTYSFLDVMCVMTGPGGVVNMGGNSGVSKEGITIEATEDIGTTTYGAGGEWMHSLHAARPAKAMVRILKTSPINALLSTLFALQTSTASLFGQNQILVSDIGRGDIVTCFGVRFGQFPSITWAEDANMNEWSFIVGRVNWNLGDGQVV